MAQARRRNQNNNNNNQGNGNGQRRRNPQRNRFVPPQQVVRRRPRVPRGLPPSHHFNAFGPQTPQALAFSIGPATHLGGLATSSQTTSTTDPKMYVFQPSGGYDQVAIAESTTGGSTFNWIGNIGITSTGIGNSPSSSSPTQVLCSRGSIRIRNTSRAADAGGVVRVLRTGTPVDFGAPSLGGLYDYVKNNPRTHTYSGSSLTMAHQWDSIPVDQTSYSTFCDPASAYTILNTDRSPAVSSIIIIFESFSTVQDYEFTLAACYYGRYRYAGPLASMAVPPPTVSLGLTNKFRDIAESVGSAGRKVATKGAETLLNRALEGVEGFVGNLFRQNMNPGRLAGRYSTVSMIEDVTSTFPVAAMAA